MDGVAELLTALVARLRMGVVTSSTAEHFYIIHQRLDQRLDLRRHFEFVLTPDCYSHSKPSPEPYLLAPERLGLDAADCLVVEDSPRGLQAATAAGLRCIVLRHRLTRHYAFAGAYKVVDSKAQLRQEIDALC